MMLRRRKGERYKNAKEFRPLFRASVEGYLLGTTFKTKKTLAEALEAVDPRNSAIPYNKSHCRNSSGAHPVGSKKQFGIRRHRINRNLAVENRGIFKC